MSRNNRLAAVAPLRGIVPPVKALKASRAPLRRVLGTTKVNLRDVMDAVREDSRALRTEIESRAWWLKQGLTEPLSTTDAMRARLRQGKLPPLTYDHLRLRDGDPVFEGVVLECGHIAAPGKPESRRRRCAGCRGGREPTFSREQLVRMFADAGTLPPPDSRLLTD